MKPAHRATIEANSRVQAELDFSDRRDFDDARRGSIGTIADARIAADNGRLAWNMADYDFMDGEAPSTVNPSLWRLSQLNRIHGLFQVTDRIYQVRGFCLANVTFIEGDTGLIVIDPLTFTEHARAALELYVRHRGNRRVVAVIYSHCHRDHYGGVRGVISKEDVDEGKVQVIGPAGFTEEAFSESILAGVAMRRRSLFQFGTSLEPGPMSHIDSGLGKAVGRGSDGFIAPTSLITQPQERRVIDGVEIVFQLTPETEAPAEMNFYFPGLRALNLAENACHTMHNLCPLRGAKTRDALAWARYLDEALASFVPSVDVVFAQHHWPVWGADRIVDFVSRQRDLYRYLHDQTLRLMSHGLTPREIASELTIPDALSKEWSTRGYYGALAHNVSAVYTHYLGPYDGNPANLNPLPPQSAGARYVEYMGGADEILRRAQSDFDGGRFRWVVEVLNHLIFADPGNIAARELSADAMEQLGYQSESTSWRNSYLLAARELRNRTPKSVPDGIPISADVVALLPFGNFLDYLAIRLNGPKAQDLSARFDWIVGSKNDCHRLTLSNGALNHLPGSHGAEADAVAQTERSQLSELSLGRTALLRALDNGELKVHGDKGLFRSFLEALDEFDPMFSVIEP